MHQNNTEKSMLSLIKAIEHFREYRANCGFDVTEPMDLTEFILHHLPSSAPRVGEVILSLIFRYLQSIFPAILTFNFLIQPIIGHLLPLHSIVSFN